MSAQLSLLSSSELSVWACHYEGHDESPVCSMRPCDPVECANYYFVNRKIDCSPFLLSPSVWGQTSLNLNARWPQPPHRLDHSARVCSKCCLVMGPTYERMQWLKKYVGVLQLGFKTLRWGLQLWLSVSWTGGHWLDRWWSVIKTSGQG